jgi:serine/threonine protein kinase
VPAGQGAVAKEDAANAAETILVSGILEEKPGSRIGHYKLLQRIGEGGCGVVYMAEQEEPIRRRVAFKVIKLGMDTKQVIARFEAERQALALMDHPNIAKVLDAGATETGRPYFVMELVRGIKITDYCDQNNLSTEGRLEIFMQVCHAIQHAHQKGIIHRDIKPSNILVTVNDGVPVPKVIDFGIAKATQQKLTDKTLFTAFEQFIGTPAYMSPEQAEMSGLDIDTRSDIYELGVLLYELLTGKTPFDAKELIQAGIEEMRRVIREQEPARPSTKLSTMGAEEQTTVAKRRQVEAPKLIHQMRGDLDWIVMKCLEKDRTRRYETANALADDLKRHLDNEPVVACPPSHLYRCQKLVRRNRLAFAMAASVAASLLLGLGAATFMFFQEKEARVQAEGARQQEAGARRQAQAAEKSARTLAEVRRLNTQVLLLVHFLPHLGGPWTPAAIGTINQAEQLAQKAKDLAGKLGPNHPEQGASMISLAFVQLARGNQEQAEKIARDGLRVLPKDHPDATMGNVVLYTSLMALGKRNAAAQLLSQDLPPLARQMLQKMERNLDAARVRERVQIQHIICTNNLKQISFSFRTWAIDHDEAFPFNVPRARGGTLELSSRGADGFEQNPAPHLLVVSNELGTTHILVCPADASKVAAESFESLTASNVTYQIRSGPGVTPNSPNEILVRCPIHDYLVDCKSEIQPGLRREKRK